MVTKNRGDENCGTTQKNEGDDHSTPLLPSEPEIESIHAEHAEKVKVLLTARWVE